MKVLLLYDYPAPASGLAMQADLLYRGLQWLGVDVQAVDYTSDAEKTWYYDWFKPDIAVGVGYWGYTPEIVLHPQKHGVLPVPWLVADGFMANYCHTLAALPLILVTSHWVKDVYIRDGLDGKNIEVLPVGCDTDQFTPRPLSDKRVAAMRAELGVGNDQLMILTCGGDLASKGGQEVLEALARIKDQVPDWVYVGKVWPQARTYTQNQLDRELAIRLGLQDRLRLVTDKVSRNYMPYLLSACDIYAAPSRLEGFGMIQVEAGACGRPVVSMRAMGMLDTLVDGETAFLARPAVENRIRETVLGPESGYEPGHRVVFNPPRIADYRANVDDLAEGLLSLMNDPALRQKMGEAGRRRAVECFDYRLVARKFVQIVQDRLGIG